MADYNRTEAAMARRHRERKLAHVEVTGAATEVAANPDSVFQLAAGLGARMRAAEILYIGDVLDRVHLAAGRAPR